VPRGKPALVGDLIVTQPLELLTLPDRPLVPVQGPAVRQHIDEGDGLELGRRLADPDHCLQIVLIGGMRALALAPAALIDLQIVHQRKCPGAQIGTFVKPIVAGDGAHQGVLNQVVRAVIDAGQRAPVTAQMREGPF